MPIHARKPLLRMSLVLKDQFAQRYAEPIRVGSWRIRWVPSALALVARVGRPPTFPTWDLGGPSKALPRTADDAQIPTLPATTNLDTLLGPFATNRNPLVKSLMLVKSAASPKLMIPLTSPEDCQLPARRRRRLFDIVIILNFTNLTLSDIEMLSLGKKGMRDGIPPGLPVPRKYQRFVECAARAADRGTDRPTACLRDAIQDDLRREFPSVARQELSRMLEKPDDYLPGFQTAGMSVGNLGVGERNAAEILGEICTKVDDGRSLKAAVLDAVTERLEAMTSARRRQIVENLAEKVSVPELKDFVSEMDRAIGAVDFHSEAERFVRLPAKSVPPACKSLNADEDLRG